MKFDGKSNHREHIVATNTQMEIIGASDSLKFKFFFNTFMEASLRWFMNLPFLFSNQLSKPLEETGPLVFSE